MFVRPTNPVSHRLARMAFIMACVAALIVASAGPLHRYLGLDIERRLRDLPLRLLSRRGRRRAGRWRPSCRRGRATAGAASWRPCWPSRSALPPPETPLALVPARPARARASTTSRPIPPIRRPLVVTLQLRRGAPNPGGLSRRERRRAAARRLSRHRAGRSCRAAGRGLQAGRRRWRWRWAGTSSPARRPKAASRRSRPAHWFGFRDDIVVRIRPEGAGSRVDIRSKSRDGESDFGVNARRIREFIARLKAESC